MTQMENVAIRTRKLSSRPAGLRAGGCSHRAIAEIARARDRFSIRYTHPAFNRLYDLPPGTRSTISTRLWHRLRRINSRNLLTHRVLTGLIEHQRPYVMSGNPADLVPLSQLQLARWINSQHRLVLTLNAERCPLNAVICHTWVSRLIKGLSVITPSGEEKPLRSFFQTSRDILKRRIKQLLDKETEDLQSGKLQRPYTDSELRELLETQLVAERCPLNAVRFHLSRWTVGQCRKDLGIPPATRRLSGDKYPPLSANFSAPFPLSLESVLKHVPSAPGVYEFSIRATNHDPRATVFYLGSSRNLRKRLRDHLGPRTKNGAIRDFLRKRNCVFRFILVEKDWQREEQRLYRLFVDTYGAAPRCNRVKPGRNRI